MISEARTDEELATWTTVRNAVDTQAPATLDAILRERAQKPELRHFLAVVDGNPVGCAFVSRSSTPGKAFLLPRVVPGARRRGVGTALLQAGAEFARELSLTTLRSHHDDDDAAATGFAARHGFAEVDRQVELVRELGPVEVDAVPPSRIVLAELCAHHLDCVRALAREAVADMPVVGGLDASAAEEFVDELVAGVVTFVALDGDRVAGFAGLGPYGAVPNVLECSFTAVDRAYRGRGVAHALKQACVAWAAPAGYHELVTWTQTGNDAMQAVNLRAGFRTRRIAITVEAPLP
jgi:mycothiol synthase